MKINGEISFEPSSKSDTIYDFVDDIFKFIELNKLLHFNVSSKMFGVFNDKRFDVRMNDKKETILNRYFESY